MKPSPYIFDEFFASGKEESISPFLTPSSRKWGKNLSLRICLLAAILLAIAFSFSFTHPTLSHVFLLGVYFLVGTPALIDTIEDLKNLEINIDVLMTLAALLSVLIGSGMEGALLLVLFELSAAMENMVTQKTKGALAHLNQISPRTAHILEPDGTTYERSVKEISAGARLLVRAGEIVPLDGKVLSGSSFVNLVHLTGESLPVRKTPGDEVPAGARTMDGSLTIEVTRASSDSTLAKIVQLITQAQEAKPQLQRLLDRLGKPYAMTIISLSLFFALTLPYLASLPYVGADGAIYRALTFLIAASPCALILATPTAYLSAISACARKGIVLKGGVILDAIASCKTIAFDKTGTLTTGELTCRSITPLTPTDITPDQALAIAAGLETHATHPIAQAITTFAKSKGISPSFIESFHSEPGLGLSGTDKGTAVSIGHASFTNPPEPIPKKEGHLATFLRIGETCFAFHFTDLIRPDSPLLISRLKLKTTMLTGDHADVALSVANQVGIQDIRSDLRPEDKLSLVTTLSNEGGLIMVGDGINDAPALARATVGISMGKIGSATAVDASDVVLLSDDLASIDWLICKAHHTLRIVRQNLIVALAVILFATTPALLGLVPLWAAVLLHEGGTLLVGLNSLRLLRR